LVFNSLEYIEAELDNYSILITPHITQPFPVDDQRPMEKDILKTGMFNAGFYAVRNDGIANNFLNWWKERMIDQCYEKPKEGLNVDQKWLNFLPFYFEKVKILKHAGCNLAYWNFHERVIEKRNGKFIANNEPLLFLHYSGYSLEYPNLISRHQTRFVREKNQVLNELFDLYRQRLIENRHEELQKIACHYKKSPRGFFIKLGFKK
jgi:hypothetical protein